MEIKEMFNTIKGKDYFTSLSYSFLSSVLCGEKVIQNAVGTWDILGFTEGIEDEGLKAEISVAFDNLTYDLLTDREEIMDLYYLIYDVYGFELDTMAYPLIMYVVKNSDYFDYEEFIDELYEVIWEFTTKDSYEDYLHYYEGDAEAKFVKILGDTMISRFSFDGYEDENNEEDEYYY